jgi:hypothetical protein
LIPVPRFEPDKSLYNSTASSAILNVLPTADGWKPMADLVEISESLGSECLGAIYVRDNNGSFTIIAGTQTHLYKLNTSASPNTWVDISSATYNVPVGDRWSFTIFGNYVVAVQLGNNPQYLDYTGSGSFADIPNAPVAKFANTVDKVLVLSHLDSNNYGLQWSDIADLTSWTPIETLSGNKSFESGGVIQGLIVNGQNAVVLQRNKMQNMQFSASGTSLFSFSEINSSRGVLSPNSIAQYGTGQFVYLSDDGFFMGAEGQAIGGERVDSWFFDEVNQNYLAQVKAVVDPLEKIVWWIYTNIRNENKMLGYDWQLDQWFQSDLVITEASSLVTAGVTWDGLSNLHATIDDVNIPFDSPLFKGGVPIMSAFTSDNKLAQFGGTSLAATIEWSQLSLGGGNYAFVREAQVETDASTLTLTMGEASKYGEAATFGAAVSPNSRTGIIPLRSNARFHKPRVEIPAGTSWNHVSSIAFNMSGKGKR